MDPLTIIVFGIAVVGIALMFVAWRRVRSAGYAITAACMGYGAVISGVHGHPVGAVVLTLTCAGCAYLTVRIAGAGGA